MNTILFIPLEVTGFWKWAGMAAALAVVILLLIAAVSSKKKKNKEPLVDYLKDKLKAVLKGQNPHSKKIEYLFLLPHDIKDSNAVREKTIEYYRQFPEYKIVEGKGAHFSVYEQNKLLYSISFIWFMDHRCQMTIERHGDD